MRVPMVRCAIAAMLLSGGVLAEAAALAAEYVPGRHRPDGLYVQPHFRDGSRQPHAAEAWYDGLSAGPTRADPVKPPPQPALEPPAATRESREPQI